MTLCLFRLPYESHLGIPSGSDFYFRYEDRDVHVRCIENDGDKIFSYTGKDMRWMTDPEIEVTGFAVDKLTPSDVFREFYRRIGVVDFEVGVVDHVKYTVSEVSFELRPNEALNTNLDDPLLRLVESILNDFIDLYRHVTQEADIRRLRIKNIPFIDTYSADNYKFNSQGIEANLKLMGRIFNAHEATTMGITKKELTEEQVRTFANLCKSGVKLQLFQRLLLDAKEQYYARAEYDLTIILVETAFETFLQEILIRTCEVRGQDKLPYGRGSNQQSIDYREAIEKGSVREYLLDYVRVLGGQNVKGGVEHNNWLNDTYEKRNDIIHRGKVGASAEEAIKSFAATGKYISYIQQILS